MGLQSTKLCNEGLSSRNKKALSEDICVDRERTSMRSALSWKFVRFRHRLRNKRLNCSEAAADVKDDDHNKPEPLASFLKCGSRQVKSMHRLDQSGAAMTPEELGTSKTFVGLHHMISSNRPVSLGLNVDLLLRTREKLGAFESTDTLLVDRTQTESDHCPFKTDDELSNCFAANDVTAQNMLDQTMTFLAYEIDPFIIEQFRNLRRLPRSGVNICSFDLLTSDSNGIDSIRKFLSVLMRDPLSEDYRLFCELLRDQGNEHYTADFLGALSAILRLQNDSTLKTKTALSSHELNLTTISEQKPMQFPECTCIYQTDFARKDNRFDVSLVYVDRESRTAKSFKGVMSLKRHKNRKSRIESDPSRVHLGDTSDRYVPMMSVHLYKQCLCDARMRSLQRLVETYACIRDLSIVKTRLEDQAKVRLGRALEQNTGLYQLDLSLSVLGNDGAMYIAYALRANQFLRVLNLSSNELTARGCDFLVKGLLRNRTLHDLDLGFNEVGDQGCSSLAAALQTSKCSLQRLRLRNNGITSHGARALFAALKTNSRLSLLDVSSNEIYDDCFYTLSDVLLYNRTLADLMIDNCRISNVACSSLARPLKINTVLRRLSLSTNPIGDAGLKALVDGIKYNRSLTDISLNMCGITNSGLWHLLDAARYNTTMKTIKLCYNLIDLGVRPVRKEGDHRHKMGQYVDGVERRSSAFIGQNVTPMTERRSSLFIERRHIMSVGESGSVAFTGNDDTSGDVISKNDLYSKLVEVLHNNSPLKVVLWGNRLDETNSTMSETLITNVINY